MNQKLTRLAERRAQLVTQAAAQRIALAQHIEPWRKPLARVDQGLQVVRYVKRHPAWVAGGVAALFAFQPGRVLHWLRRGWGVWHWLHKLRSR